MPWGCPLKGVSLLLNNAFKTCPLSADWPLANQIATGRTLLSRIRLKGIIVQLGVEACCYGLVYSASMVYSQCSFSSLLL